MYIWSQHYRFIDFDHQLPFKDWKLVDTGTTENRYDGGDKNWYDRDITKKERIFMSICWPNIFMLLYKKKKKKKKKKKEGSCSL